MADWYEATGAPVERSALASSDMRAEFARIESNLSAKMPVLEGNGGKLIRVNAGGTALEVDDTIQEGSFTATLGGVSGIVQGTILWRKQSNLMSLRTSADILGTSNDASVLTVSTLPTAIRPAATRVVSGVFSANGTAIRSDGYWTISTAGVLTATWATAFIASSKGLPNGWHLFYTL